MSVQEKIQDHYDSSLVISEMVIAGNITRRRAISVARTIWIVCSSFFNSRFFKEYLQGFSLSINRLQRFSIVLPFVFFEQ